TVALILNLPYPRFIIGRASATLKTLDFADDTQVTNLRYSRLQVCATSVGNTVNRYDGMGAVVRARDRLSPRLLSAIPVGGSPTGAGESPALPLNTIVVSSSLSAKYSCVRSMRPKCNPYSPCHFTTLATAILAFQVIDARSQAPPLVISRIASNTNGLALSWSGENTNAAYTVQFRSSLPSG